MSTIAPARRYTTGELVVITGQNIAEELDGKVATILQTLRPAGNYTVKVLHGPVVLVTADDLVDAAAYWERETSS